MPDPEDPLVADYLQEWLGRRQSQLRPTTLRCYRQTINSYLVPHLGDQHLSQIDRLLLEDLYVDLLAAGGLNGKPLSARTVEPGRCGTWRSARAPAAASCWGSAGATSTSKQAASPSAGR